MTKAPLSIGEIVGEYACAVLAATEATAITGATVRLMSGIGAKWHLLLTGLGGEHRRRLAAHRCSRALFDRVVGDRLTSPRAGRTCVVEAQRRDAVEHWARCAFGFSEQATISKSDLDRCSEAIRHALGKLLALQVEQRRARVLRHVLGGGNVQVYVFNARGALLERCAASAQPVSDGVLVALRASLTRRGLDAVHRVTVDGTTMELAPAWLQTDHGEEALQVVELRPWTRVGADVRRQFEHCGLTHRELEVAELIVQGRSNRVIAATLCISEDTVKTHCRHIFGKLGITRRRDFLPLLAEPLPVESR